MKEHRQLALRLESPVGRGKITIWKNEHGSQEKNKIKPIPLKSLFIFHLEMVTVEQRGGNPHGITG